MVWFAFVGVFTYASGLIDAKNYFTGGMCLIISMLIGFIIAGYNINVIKSGIELDDKVPAFEWYENFMTGFDNFVVLIFYFIIPALIVMLVGLDTNILGNAIAIKRELSLQVFNVYMGNPIDITFNTISPVLAPFVSSLATTITVVLILFIIFSIIRLMAEARLANTGSLMEGLNIFEAAKDMTRIGLGKVILLILLFVVIIAIIAIILMVIFGFPFLLPIIYILITPYLVLAAKRAIGLLYSDIA